MTGIPQKR